MGTFNSTRGQGEDKACICANCEKHFDKHEQDEAGYRMCPKPSQ